MTTHKLDTYTIFLEWKASVELASGRKLKDSPISDNGGEYMYPGRWKTS